MPYIAPMDSPLSVLRVPWDPDPARLASLLRPVLTELLGAARTSTSRPEAVVQPEPELGPAKAPAPAAEPDDTATAPPAVVIEGLVRAGERVLADIEALELAKARIEADLLTAYGALHTIEAQQIAALPATARSRLSAMVPPDRIVAEEIALATGVGTGEVARRMTLATAPRRHRAVLAALRAGQTSLYRALQVASETAPLCDADVATVEESVLAPSRDGWPVTQRTFVTRLRRAVASVDQRGADDRRAQATTRRGVFGRLTQDGMGCLTVTTDAAAVAAVMDRLDAGARSLRGGGDPRTLDQLRCDLATEALLGDHLDESSRTSSGTGAITGTGTAPVRRRGETPGLVWLVVPFEVATGASETACELPGHGWVTAAHAREIMTRPGSIWRTLPVDVHTGYAISRPTRSYRPTAAMVEHVQAVDGVCRGPGCQVVATRCDLDHETPWPAGPTSADNLYAKHRLHHNIKTDGIWTSEQVADNGLEWTTLTGRRYTTHPKNWREGLDRPPKAHPPDGEPPPF